MSNCIEYISSFIQNRNINNIDIIFGKVLDDNIFDRNVKGIYEDIYNKLINYHNKKISTKKYYIFNNYKLVKDTKNTYYKTYEYDSKIIDCSDLNTNINFFIKMTNEEEISQLEYPNQLENDIEYVNEEIDINISEYIKILLINNRYISIKIEKNAYIDTTIEILSKFLNNITDNIYN